MIEQILAEREKRYGKFEDNAELSQYLKETMRGAELWDLKSEITREALDFIQGKIARIINGDERYADSWADIAGYAQLVLNEIAPEQST